MPPRSPWPEAAARPPSTSRPSLVERSGSVGPTVWWDGRVVGAWAQRADGEIVWRIPGWGRRGGRGGGGAADGMAGCDQVTPGFRTPVEKELSAG
ncbi:crosslink repair DNA glycosylase YcaQ family protein [Streptomyces mirabilis]|uniref:DNA glycosylase AlkZ-like family protein n=1 Tax=Streptomyces mirabilis TaxID=68239 RepID=UPI003330DC5E